MRRGFIGRQHHCSVEQAARALGIPQRKVIDLLVTGQVKAKSWTGPNRIALVRVDVESIHWFIWARETVDADRTAASKSGAPK